MNHHESKYAQITQITQIIPNPSIAILDFKILLLAVHSFFDHQGPQCAAFARSPGV